jgi:hypothetical protein
MPTGIYERKPIKKSCKTCSIEFMSSGRRAGFCSRECREKSYHERKLVLHRKWRLENRARLNKHSRETYLDSGKKEWSKKYEKTRFGYLMRKYRNMQSRITGVQKSKFHLYKGLELLSREDFYNWAYNHAEFLKLFVKWRNSGYDRKLAPSVNRIDSSRGYVLANMEWITHSENSRLGSINRNNKLKI